ncbi:MAG: nitroreductase family protein [Aristaeellaceae bacterium]
MTNEVLTALRERSSCKAFAEEMPDEGKIQAIAQAALTSPSATNSQPWQILVVTDRELIREMEEETIRRMGEIPAYKGFYDMVQSTGMKLFYKAPCMIVLAIDKKNPYSPYDCGILSQTICVAAQSLGVGSHIVAINDVVFSGDKGAYFRKALKFPDGYEFGLAVLLGNEVSHNAPHAPNPARITCIDSH